MIEAITFGQAQANASGMCPPDPGVIVHRRSGAISRGESACRPGSIIPPSAAWAHYPKGWLTCDFTSHAFSTVPVSFQALTEQRRNWWSSGRLTLKRRITPVPGFLRQSGAKLRLVSN